VPATNSYTTSSQAHETGISFLFTSADHSVGFRHVSGLTRRSPLPPFSSFIPRLRMSEYHQIPSTPRIISPSPTPSDHVGSGGSYFAPVTRSAAKRANSSTGIEEEQLQELGSDAERKARMRSRSPSQQKGTARRRLSGLTPVHSKSNTSSSTTKQRLTLPAPEDTSSNGHLSPFATAEAYLRNFSRSPSPLGLIPIHQSWRSFVHRHEVPRKLLHVSIGFFTLSLYVRGVQTSSIHPWLLALLVPIASVDIVRHRVPSFNALYVRCLGAFMRESEVHDRYNGVIWYLLGAWTATRFFPKDVGVMSILLLSWCDTAASTFGRLYGRYTPRISRKKSLAGSLAAMSVGMLTAGLWYGYIAPSYYGYEQSFAYKGSLSLPAKIRTLPIFSGIPGTITGFVALSILSLWSGLVASVSEAVEIWDIDDNLTIPVLSGLGLWGFLHMFG
jgi:diacylglycerol kinase (CTP)